jgi:hypothetical protein
MAPGHTIAVMFLGDTGQAIQWVAMPVVGVLMLFPSWLAHDIAEVRDGIHF